MKTKSAQLCHALTIQKMAMRQTRTAAAAVQNVKIANPAIKILIVNPAIAITGFAKKRINAQMAS